MLPPFSYIRVATIEEAVRFLSEDGARLHAGGTDLNGCLRDGIFTAATVVSITRLKELSGIQATSDGGLRIGALTTISQIARSPMVKDRYPVLAMAASEVASPQLRRQGTIGGNLCQKPRCWYYRGEFHCLRKGGDQCYAVDGENRYHCIFGGENCYIVHPSDTASALVALQASVTIVGPQGRRTVAAENFHVPPARDYTRETVLEPGEIVTHITLPPPPDGLRSAYCKVRARRSWDFALAGTALAVVFKSGQVSDARIVLSGGAPVPWRSREAEAAITRRRLDQKTAQAAADVLLGSAHPLSQNEYKLQLFRGLLTRELLALS